MAHAATASRQDGYSDVWHIALRNQMPQIKRRERATVELDSELSVRVGHLQDEESGALVQLEPTTTEPWFDVAGDSNTFRPTPLALVGVRVRRSTYVLVVVACGDTWFDAHVFSRDTRDGFAALRFSHGTTADGQRWVLGDEYKGARFILYNPYRARRDEVNQTQ